MTDSVDTDALRAARRLVARLVENCLANAEAPNADDLVALARDAYEEGQEDAELRSADEVDQLRGDRHQVTGLMVAEHDEVVRLRAVIENAPHSAICDSYEAKPCTCWKSRA